MNYVVDSSSGSRGSLTPRPLEEGLEQPGETRCFCVVLAAARDLTEVVPMVAVVPAGGGGHGWCTPWGEDTVEEWERAGAAGAIP